MFQVDVSKLPECVEIVPAKGRIQPEGTQDLTLKFMCKEQKAIKGDINILIRGGKTLK